jgi:putative oxidoreductase
MEKTIQGDIPQSNLANKQTQITSADLSLLSVRIVVGSVFMAHGAQQLFGVFDGPGLAGTMSAQGPGGGGILGLLTAIGLFFGGVGIVTGLLARFSAAANIVIMIGAILLVHAPNGFFLVNGRYQYQGGYEFNLVLIGLCLPILIAGPGRLSIKWGLALYHKLSSGRQPHLSLLFE